MTDEEFENAVEWFVKYKGFADLPRPHIPRDLAPEKLTVLFEVVIKSPNSPFEWSSCENVDSSHLDIILRSPCNTDRLALFFNFKHLITNSHIEKCLNDEWRAVREAAYRHPCCTEAQKVAYHLKWGNK